MSEIRVDTISEKTSANGVAVDGVTLKDGGIAATAPSTFSSTGNTNNFKIISTDDGTSTAPDLQFYKNSSSPAANDFLGRVDFRGNDDAGNETNFITMFAQATSVANGSETAKFDIQDAQNVSMLELSTTSGSASAVFNEDSADIDFRVESNGNTHMLFVDGGNDRVGFITAPDLGKVHIKSADSGGNVNVAADELVIENSGSAGITILTGNTTSGSIHFGDDGDNDKGFISYSHNTDDMFFSVNGNGSAYSLVLFDGGQVSTGGETAPDTGDGGLCLDQGANDAQILTLKSSDIAHGMTGGAETDTYAAFQKYNVGEGGLGVSGFSESASPGINLFGAVTTADTGTAHTDEAPVRVVGSIKDGTGFTNFGADDNLFTIMNNTNNQVIVKGDGEIFSNQTATVGVFDTYEDAQLVRAYDLSQGKYKAGLIDSKFDKFVQYNAKDLADANLIGKEKDGTPNSFVNITGMQRLHNGAIWQQYEKHQKLASAFYKLATKTIGKEEADKLLTEEEIQLLN